MKKIENADIIGYKSWKANDKAYMLIAVTFTEKETQGKMCGTIFVNKPYQVGTKINVIQHQGRLYVID
jgi:hypothetical protein